MNGALKFVRSNPASIYLLKVNNRNTRTRCDICSKLTIKTPEPYYWPRSGVFILNSEHISHHVVVFLLLTLIADWEDTRIGCRGVTRFVSKNLL